MCEPSNGSLRGVERGWGVEERLTTSCDEECTFAAHWERGTTAFPVSDLQMLSSILALSQLKQGGKKFLSLHAWGSVLEFVGSTGVFTHNLFFRQGSQTPTQYE